MRHLLEYTGNALDIDLAQLRTNVSSLSRFYINFTKAGKNKTKLYITKTQRSNSICIKHALILYPMKKAPMKNTCNFTYGLLFEYYKQYIWNDNI